MRRRVSILLVMMTVFSLMFFSACAETSHSDSFSPFTRTGDPATDIVNVAAAQLGRSKSSLGYVDAWCSYFVGDCAKLIGQSSVIPFYGRCSDLYAFLMNSGAAIISESNRQKGDLIFYWETKVGVHAYYNHVGIMSDRTNCISGNMDNSYVRSYPYDQINQKHRIGYTFVRPNYRPSQPTGYLDVNFYVNGQETIDITGIGTFDVSYGNTVLTGQTDFCREIVEGTSYQVSNIQAAEGYVYAGLASGSDTLSGTVAANITRSVWLTFNSKTYRVSYNGNAADAEGVPAAQTKTHGQGLALSETRPVRPNYQFLGWALSASASAPAYQPGDIYTSNANATLYAVWKKETVTVSLDANGGSCDTAAIEVTAGSAYGTLPVPTRPGYSFAGWYTDAAGGSKVVSSTVVSAKTNHTLYARWSPLGSVILPAKLQIIPEEAFSGSSVLSHVTVPADCARIESKAFANCKNLVSVYIPSMYTYVASDAFDGSPNIVLYCLRGSSAYNLAVSSGGKIPYRLINEVSDWVPASDVPEGASLTGDEKWTYKETVTDIKTSYNTSMSGYTQTGFTWKKTGSGTNDYADYPGGFDSSHALYSKYSHSALTASEDTVRRDISTSRLTYIYYHWSYSTGYLSGGSYNVYVNPTRGICAEGYDCQYFAALELADDLSPSGNVYKYWRDDPADGSWWWYRFPVYRQTYTEYKKLFTYEKKTVTEKESTSEVTASDTVSDIVHWVKYYY